MTEPVRIAVGMLGSAFMGRAHASAYRALQTTVQPASFIPELVTVAGRDAEAVAAAAPRLGFAEGAADWRALVADPRIALFDDCGPNHLHAEPVIAAVQAGKHVVCEKPLARTADESHAMWIAAERAGVKHMTAFNYRFVPAVRLARELLDAGELGEVRHFRARYLQDWLADAPHSWRLDAGTAGSGAIGDLGSHLVDLARYLVGDLDAVMATADRLDDRPEAVDAAFQAIVTFAGGASGTLEASRCALGRKNALAFEINGSRGTLSFALERLNELCWSEGGNGVRTLQVTGDDYPFARWWWPPGHVLGWEHSFVHELAHLLEAIALDLPVGPHAATFEDGLRAAEACDAIVVSAGSGRREAIRARPLAP
jgi:predicted dehydrogenase